VQAALYTGNGSWGSIKDGDFFEIGLPNIGFLGRALLCGVSVCFPFSVEWR
jgi:hypothetical protein